MGTTRRDALLMAAGGLAAWAGPAAAARRRIPFARTGSFPSGVLAGYPGERELRLWTRLDGHDRSVKLTLEVARDPGFGRVVHRSTETAHRWRDMTVHARVRGRLLRPGEEYWYRFATRAGSSPVGRVRTLRPPDSREPLKVAFFSCQGWQPGYFNAHADMARQDLDLAVCLGDYIYEKTDDVGPREDTIGREGNGFAQTLDEYRAKWRLYRSDPDLQALHAHCAFIGIPDSHEFASDDAGHIGGAPVYVPLVDRVRNGLLSYFENQPLARFAGSRYRVHRALRLNANAELFLLDWRPYYVDGEPEPPLGAAQRAWLLDGLAASRATWKVMGSGPMMMALDVPYGRPLNRGQWDGYPHERRRIMQHVLERGIAGVTVQSGDIHTFFAGRVTTTGRIDGRAAATEFIGGAVTSEPGPEMIFGDDGAPLTADLFALGANANNPHLAFSEHLHAGYALAEYRPDEMLVTFRAVEDKRVRPSAAYDLARFRVRPGDPRVERVA